MNNLRMVLAERRAENILAELNIATLPIDPSLVAKNRGIVVEAKPRTADGVSGMLLRHGNNFGIMYATHIRSKGFQRFSIAHELGHYFLDGHIDYIFKDGNIHESCAGFISADNYEREADHFAAGLLMPEALFKTALKNETYGLNAVESLAALCITPLTATAIRYVSLCDIACAIVLSSEGRINFCSFSEKMKLLPNLKWPKRGSCIPRNSTTADFFNEPSRIAGANRAEADIDIQEWFDGEISAQAKEETVGLGNYGKVLTVVTVTDAENEQLYEEEDEEELIESWTPRFRR